MTNSKPKFSLGQVVATPGALEALNDSGQTMGDGKLIRLPLYYTEGNLKEKVVHPYMEGLWPAITSTAALSTTQIQELYQCLDYIIAERSGVSVPWPSNEPPLLQEET